MGAAAGASGGAGGGRRKSFLIFDEILTDIRDGHKHAARAAFQAHKMAAALGAYSVAAELAEAGAHMEAASGYAAAARRLIRGTESHDRASLRPVYPGRLDVLISHSALLSTKSYRIIGRLSDGGPGEGELVDGIRRTRKLAARSAKQARTARRGMREALSLMGMRRDSG